MKVGELGQSRKAGRGVRRNVLQLERLHAKTLESIKERFVLAALRVSSNASLKLNSERTQQGWKRTSVEIVPQVAGRN